MLFRYGLLLTTLLLWLAVEVDAGGVFSFEVKRVNDRTGANQLRGNTRRKRPVFHPRSLARSPLHSAHPPCQAPLSSSHPRLLTRHRLSLMHRTYSTQLGLRDEFVYETAISIGTCGQEFLVHLDTGSPYTWVPANDCGRRGLRSCDENIRSYDYKKRETFELQAEPFYIQYGSGNAQGWWVKDKFSLGWGNKKMELREKFEFGVANQTEHVHHGVLGLSFSPQGQEKKSIFGELLRQRLLKRRMFTIFLKRCPNGEEECTNAGTLTLGGFDQRNCGPPIGTVPLAPNATHWRFQVNAISFDENGVIGPFFAITDTGASAILLPWRLFQTFCRSINTYPISAVNGQPTSSHLITSCQNVFSIKLRINGKTYEIPHEELILRLGNDRCQVLVSEYPDSNDIFLGGPWARSFCQIHYWPVSCGRRGCFGGRRKFTKPKIGFAEPK